MQRQDHGGGSGARGGQRLLTPAGMRSRIRPHLPMQSCQRQRVVEQRGPLLRTQCLRPQQQRLVRQAEHLWTDYLAEHAAGLHDDND